jgi:hypothetical protein
MSGHSWHQEEGVFLRDTALRVRHMQQRDPGGRKLASWVSSGTLLGTELITEGNRQQCEDRRRWAKASRLNHQEIRWLARLPGDPGIQQCSILHPFGLSVSF